MKILELITSFIGNKFGVRLIVFFVVLLFIAGGLGFCTRAEAQEDALSLAVSAGPVFFGGSYCEDFIGLSMTQEFGERKWIAGLATHGKGSCKEEKVAANMGGWIARTTHLGRLSIGFGVSVWNHGDIAVAYKEIHADRLQPRTHHEMTLQFAILLRHHVTDRLVLDWLHFSSGGTTLDTTVDANGNEYTIGFNRGRNFLLLGWRM